MIPQVLAQQEHTALQVNIIGTEFKVTLGPAVTLAQIKQLVRAWGRCISTTPLVACDPDQETMSVQSPYSAGLYRIDRNKSVSYLELQAGSFAELAELITSHLTLGAIESQAGKLTMLHACGVADPESGGVVALVAKSGTGKTTASRLLGKTFSYVTDETVAIEPSGSVRAYPKPLSIKNGGQHKEQIGPDELGLVEAPKQPFIHSIALLNRREDWQGPPLLESVPLADAVLALIPETSSQRRITRPLQSLCELVLSTGGLRRITYAEAKGLPETIEGILSEPSIPGRPEWTSFFEAVDQSEAIPEGYYRRAHGDDAVEIDGDLLFLSGDQVIRISGIGPAIWRAASSSMSREDLLRVVTEAHGKPDGYGALFDEALTHLLEAGVLSDGRG